jgi:lipopolysaccharide/colanic/teichoic acid biosynthesis glycosyltransferase
MKGQEIYGIPVLADRNDAAETACREWIDEVFISIPHNEPYPEEMEAQFIDMGIVVHIGLFKMSHDTSRRQFVERMGNYTVLTTAITDVTPAQHLMKRGLDIIGGLIGCIFTCILFIFIAPAIYIKSPGPIFFKQVRVGINGKKFNMYKFRSMYLDAEKRKAELMAQNRIKDGMMFKLDADPRIIGCKVNPDGSFKKGIGNFIRDYSLDEFPQFFNVLKGDMSLVGTRPPTVDEWEKYELHHRARLAVKPGITGLWQVSGRSGILDFEEVVRLDTQYIADWSMENDIKILFKTIKVVFCRKGAM